MPSILNKIYTTLCTGWVVSYPGGNGDTPDDFFSHRDRPRNWFKDPFGRIHMDPREIEQLQLEKEKRDSRESQS